MISGKSGSLAFAGPSKGLIGNPKGYSIAKVNPVVNTIFRDFALHTLLRSAVEGGGRFRTERAFAVVGRAIAHDGEECCGVCPVWDEWDILVRTERRVRGLAIPRNVGLPFFEGGMELFMDGCWGQKQRLREVDDFS